MHAILLRTSESCWITVWTRHEPVSHKGQIMEMLTDSVIVPCTFHDFKDAGKSQCMLIVDQSRTITTVFFKICSPIRFIFFSWFFCCCYFWFFDFGFVSLLMFLVGVGWCFWFLFVCMFCVIFFSFRLKAQIKISKF